jgi:putative endonuclease
MFYVYVLQSQSDENRFYLGSTNDLKHRLKSHNQGESKATKGNQWKLMYYEAYITLNAARHREHKLKHDGRSKRFLMQRIKESLKVQDDQHKEG